MILRIRFGVQKVQEMLERIEHYYITSHIMMDCWELCVVYTHIFTHIVSELTCDESTSSSFLHFLLSHVFPFATSLVLSLNVGPIRFNSVLFCFASAAMMGWVEQSFSYYVYGLLTQIQNSVKHITLMNEMRMKPDKHFIYFVGYVIYIHII